jgi:hypothetical protein
MKKINIKRTRNLAGHPLALILAAFGLMSVATFVLAPIALAQASGAWIPTGSMNVPRSGHTATLLPNGKVLVAGGDQAGSAELYDPATGTWSVTGSMNTPRSRHTATLLPNGKLLVAGGDSLGSPELYDPATGTWSITGSLNIPRRDLYTATLLANDKVLVVGGLDTSTDAELYDPATGTWSVTGNLNTGRFWHTATLLPDGKVLVAGGAGGGSSAELYDPASGIWNITGSLTGDRYGQTAILLQNGKVLVAGGSDDTDLASALGSAELYDPVTGTWSVTGNLNASRIFHTATLLSDGKVLIAGGYTDNWVQVDDKSVASPTSLNSAELYDPTTRTWSITGNLNTRSTDHTATLLQNGKVLVAGGDYWTTDGSNVNDGTYPCGLKLTCSPKALNAAELYDPKGDPSDTLPALPLTIAGPVLPEAEVGVAYTTPLVSGGVPPYAVNIMKGVFPQGLSDTMASGALSGTPTSSRSRSFTVQITDDLGSSVTGTFSLKIFPALGKTTRTLKAGINGKPYEETLKAAGGKKPYNWSLVSGNLPAGLTLDSLTGAIAGTPTETGAFDLTIHATDPVGGIAETALILTRSSRMVSELTS